MSWEHRLEKCRNVLSKEEVILTVEGDLGTNDFQLIDYVIKPASQNPLGFLGDHMKMKVNVKLNNSTQEKNYFIKKIPTEVPEHLEWALKSRAFYKEIEAYKTLFKDLKDAQKDPDRRTRWCPDFYYARNAEIFVIEDITLSGFSIIEERSLMDEEHIKATLRCMAALHASNFVFEEKFNRGEIGHSSISYKRKCEDGKVDIGEIYQHLIFETEITDEPGHPGTLFYQACVRSNPALVEILPGYTADEKEKINKEFPKLIARMVEMTKPSKKYKNIFIHGDAWANNLMFRKNNGKVEATLIDFQMTRYAPPAQDIAFLFNLTQTKEFLQEKQNELIKYYYDVFTQELAKNDLKAEKLLPWKILVESCDYYHEFGAINATCNLPLVLTPSDITGKFLASPELFNLNMLYDRSEMIKECFLKDEIYRSRVMDALNYIIRKYIFKY